MTATEIKKAIIFTLGTLMPMALAASSSLRTAMHCRPYLEFLKRVIRMMMTMADTSAIASVVSLGMPVRPDAPPVRVVARFSSAVMASPKPSVTKEI